MLKYTRIPEPAVPSSYVVELGVFQGPLDLLLHLIEKEELDITQVALAQVADQYLAYLEQMPQRDPGDLSAFLVVAVRLLWIKSRALLPRPPLQEEGEEDVGADLVRQLQEYRRYKEAARQLQRWLEEGRRTFGRLSPPPLPLPRPAELEGATLDAMLEALQRRFQELAAAETVQPLAVPRRVTLAERARRIHDLLQTQEKVDFTSLLQESPTQEEIVVTVWAVLELFKRRWILFQQEELFGPIAICRRSDTAADWDGGAEWWGELEDLA